MEVNVLYYLSASMYCRPGTRLLLQETNGVIYYRTRLISLTLDQQIKS
jgi:hypothetical protein